MALDSATFLSFFSALLAASAVLDTSKRGSFWLKITVASISFLTSLVPLMIKLYVFLKSKQTRRLLIYRLLQKFLLSDYYEEFSFNSWARGTSTYSNIFCENRSFVVSDFRVISTYENLYDLQENNTNSPDAKHTNEREIDFGFISRNAMRTEGKTPEDDEKSRNDYITERIYFQDKTGYDHIATMIVRDFEVGGRSFRRGQYFLRGQHKTDDKGNWDESRFSFMYYPKRRENTDLGDVRIDAEFHPEAYKLRFRVRTLTFPQGLLTPWVDSATSEDFINSIKVVEYLDEKGWIEWDEKRRVNRRGAHVFRAVNLTNAVIMLRKNVYKLYEVNHLTYNEPVYIE